MRPNKEGIMGGKEGNFAKGKGYEGMMGSKEGFEGMKRVRDYEGKRGKVMGGGSDWLLKRGIWEKQVRPKAIEKKFLPLKPAEAGHGSDGGEGGDGVRGVQHQQAARPQPGQR